MQYKIKEVAEGEEKPVDILSTPIVSTGQEVVFTINELVGDSLTYHKQLKELTAEREFELKKIENVEMHHPFVKDMEDIDLMTCYMYAESKAKVKARDKVIAQINAQLEALNQEVAEIKEQLPELKDFELNANDTQEEIHTPNNQEDAGK